jgi:hypothetical protein
MSSGVCLVSSGAGGGGIAISPFSRRRLRFSISFCKDDFGFFGFPLLVPAFENVDEGLKQNQESWRRRNEAMLSYLCPTWRPMQRFVTFFQATSTNLTGDLLEEISVDLLSRLGPVKSFLLSLKNDHHESW